MTYSLTVRQAPSSVGSKPGEAGVNFGTDLNSEPAFLSGIVTTSVEFASAMNVLGNVVRLDKKPQKDHSAYQAWVSNQYLLELIEQGTNLNNDTVELLEEAETIKTNLQPLKERSKEISKEIGKFFAGYNIGPARSAYYSYLYKHDTELWILLDPIVSVQNDGTFFEAFSMDESVYARVYLPHANVASMGEIVSGTTNIDFSAQLNREFRRVRSYRPLTLTVGQMSVGISTEAQNVVEEKIPLPETWVQGLVEVQSVLSLATTNFSVSSDFISEIIACLEGEVESHGPRSLKFFLSPGQPIKVEVEPWGIILEDPTSSFAGEEEQVIRIWGRRRLSVMKEILPANSKVAVTLLGSGMPSFWSVSNNGVELTIGLSGWASNDWASRAKFSSFIPTIDVEQREVDLVRKELQKVGIVTADNLAEQLKLTKQKTNSILQKLCLGGKAMFHPSDSTYRWRNLFPELELEKRSTVSDEERFSKKIESIEFIDDEMEGNLRLLNVLVDEKQVTLKINEDGRPTYAQCTCPYFNYHKLKAGPCRHMIAVLVKLGVSND